MCRPARRPRLVLHVAGWAIDPAAPSGTGISTIHVWAFSADGTASVFLGAASFGSRPDVAAAFGPQFQNAGFSLAQRGSRRRLARRRLRDERRQRAIRHGAGVLGDRPGTGAPDHVPAPSATVEAPFVIGGWAIDPAAPSGTGIAAIQSWAFKSDARQSSSSGGVVRQPARRRCQIGPQFQNAGFGLVANGLSPGEWHIGVYAMSVATGLFDLSQAFFVTVR